MKAKYKEFARGVFIFLLAIAWLIGAAIFGLCMVGCSDKYEFGDLRFSVVDVNIARGFNREQIKGDGEEVETTDPRATPLRPAEVSSPTRMGKTGSP